MQKVISKLENAILTLTISNPKKMNAIDNEMSLEIIQEIIRAEEQRTRVIVIESKSIGGVFSAGHDLDDLEFTGVEVSKDPMFLLFDKILKTPIPVIVKVDGDAFAGALHLLIVADMVYATDTSPVVMTANKVGVPFLIKNYTNWLGVVGAHRVKELFYTAHPINAYDACNIGIYNQVFTSKEQLNARVRDVCEQIKRCDIDGVANSKLQINSLISSNALSVEQTHRIESSHWKIMNSNEFRQRVKEFFKIIKSQHKERLAKKKSLKNH